MSPIAVNTDADAEVLSRGELALGLRLGADARVALIEYTKLLQKWNAVYNLTAIRDPRAMLLHHIVDCLAVIPVLREGFDRGPGDDGGPGADLLAPGTRLLDVGSGGGLPGVVLAICLPEIEVRCVDTVGKKAAFITQVKVELGLRNLTAIHARVESLRVPQHMPPQHLIISRAFSSLAQFVSLTAHLLDRSACWIAMKGQLPFDELTALPEVVRQRRVLKLEVPDLAAERHLVFLAP